MELFIGVNAWIIQDGNYEDFRVGDVRHFALEFYPIRMQSSQLEVPSNERLHANHYELRGQVVFVKSNVWILDFGMMAYQNHDAPNAIKLGDWIEGEFSVGIDPFFYFEDLRRIPGIPELRCNWRVEKIWLETTPWLSNINERGQTVLSRDEKKESFKEVEVTDAWHDDGSNAHYILQCRQTS